MFFSASMYCSAFNMTLASCFKQTSWSIMPQSSKACKYWLVNFSSYFYLHFYHFVSEACLNFYTFERPARMVTSFSTSLFLEYQKLFISQAPLLPPLIEPRIASVGPDKPAYSVLSFPVWAFMGSTWCKHYDIQTLPPLCPTNWSWYSAMCTLLWS